MQITFKKAELKGQKVRLALSGPAGSGKTYTALQIAAALAKGGKIAVLDTEHGSASKYAGLFDFDVFEPDTFSPEVYTEFLHAASKAGYAVAILDSLSHAWVGTGGALDQVEKKTKYSGNKYTAWGDVTPLQNAMVDAIISTPIHVIATMRAKMDYVLEQNDKGKSVPRKIGLAPVQRDGMEYEFDLVGELNSDNDLQVTKTRAGQFVPNGSIWPKPGEQFAGAILAWLEGASPTDVAAQIAAARETFREVYGGEAEDKEKRLSMAISGGTAATFEGLTRDQLATLQRGAEKKSAESAKAA